jgi:hypothetical protein
MSLLERCKTRPICTVAKNESEVTWSKRKCVLDWLSESEVGKTLTNQNKRVISRSQAKF